MATSIRRTTTTVQTGNRFVVSKHYFHDRLLTDIFEAYYSARKNKRNTSSQVKFERNLSDNLLRLHEEIISFRYKVGRSMCFVVREPVPREVFAASFRDRVVHHLLYNWLMPLFERVFIYDSYSCRKGKGTLLGIKRLEHHIKSCTRNFSRQAYILKLDIQSYFININRRRLYDIVSEHVRKFEKANLIDFDVQIADYLLKNIVYNDPVKGCYMKGLPSDWDLLPKSKSLFYARKGCGLPIGNLTSQLFSNIYLSRLDDYVKRELKFKHYGRYVDDFYLVSEDKDKLLACIDDIDCFLMRELDLKLHPKKVYIATARKGASFLGATVKPYGRLVSSKSLSRVHRNVYNAYQYEKNPYRLQAILNSYLGYGTHFKNFE